MPIYEFRCGECGERLEALVAAGTEAETCGTKADFVARRRRARDARKGS